MAHFFRPILLLVLLLPFLPASAQEAASSRNDLAGQLIRLSDRAQVSLITYSPGEELYQAFGHSAIRVRDDFLGLDRLYNFGVFDFETPNFYVKFAHGDLRYQLAVSPGEEEIRVVGAYGQGVTELPLNLSPDQRQALFEALEVNLLPENRFYRYDFVLDNCSTRPRDVIERITGSPVVVRDAGQTNIQGDAGPLFHSDSLGRFWGFPAARREDRSSGEPPRSVFPACRSGTRSADQQRRRSKPGWGKERNLSRRKFWLVPHLS